MMIKHGDFHSHIGGTPKWFVYREKKQVKRMIWGHKTSDLEVKSFKQQQKHTVIVCKYRCKSLKTIGTSMNHHSSRNGKHNTFFHFVLPNANMRNDATRNITKPGPWRLPKINLQWTVNMFESKATWYSKLPSQCLSWPNHCPVVVVMADT